MASSANPPMHKCFTSVHGWLIMFGEQFGMQKVFGKQYDIQQIVWHTLGSMQTICQTVISFFGSAVAAGPKVAREDRASRSSG